MIKAIIFDCLGVLYIPIGEDFYRSHVANYEQHKTEIRDLARQADYGAISQDELVTTIAELLKLDVEQVRRNILGSLIRNWALLAYAAELRKKYKIGMLSNLTKEMMDQFFTQKEQSELFDTVVISGEVGMGKPEPAIFELTCQQLEVEPTEAIMIDDSPINCSGAIEAGLQAIVYQNFEQMKSELERLL